MSDTPVSGHKSVVSNLGGMKMNGFVKGILFVVVLIYIVSPIDFLPGPVDDIIVLLLGIAAQKGLTVKGE